jgi:hypothetical protein
MLETDFTRTMAVQAPADNRQKVVYAQNQSQGNGVWGSLGNGINGVGKGIGNAANAAGQGAHWFFSELFRPVDAIRRGMIDTLGVQEPVRRTR